MESKASLGVFEKDGPLVLGHNGSKYKINNEDHRGWLKINGLYIFIQIDYNATPEQAKEIFGRLSKA